MKPWEHLQGPASNRDTLVNFENIMVIFIELSSQFIFQRYLNHSKSKSTRSTVTEQECMTI